MKKIKPSLVSDVVEVCPSCGGETTSRSEVDSFTYGASSDQVQLTASVIVYACKVCTFEFTGPDAELSRHEAVCRHLGLLTPTEIRGIREQFEMSRAQFAAATKLGEATIARWERGTSLQNPAYDVYLRLLRNPTIMATVVSEATGAKDAPLSEFGRFRVLRVTETMRSHSKSFSLRTA